MTKSFRTLDDVDVKGKRVLLRVDLNVPMENGRVSDATRLERIAPTIAEISDKGGKVILLAHFGRPKGRDAKDSLKPVAEALAKVIKKPVAFAEDCIGEAAAKAVAAMKDGDILCLENTRFHKEEEKNDPAFVAELAKLGDIWVNDAFSAAHRAHATTEGLGHKLPAYAGRTMQAELDALGKALEAPTKPVIAIIGGAKVSTKINLLNNLITKVDALVIGGAMANTFLRAQGYPTGRSLVEEGALEAANEVWKIFGNRLVLPVDLVCAQQVQPGQPTQIFPAHAVDPGWIALDIGPQSVALFAERLRGSGTVVWNGPMGMFEIAEFGAGTRGVGEAIASSGAYTLVGGGDTAAAIDALGLTGRFSWVSTGGGATLEYLEGRQLPGVAILKEA